MDGIYSLYILSHTLSMNRVLRILLPVTVLGSSIAFGKMLIATAPETERKPPKPVLPLVEVIEVSPIDYPIQLQSRGTITPQTQGELVAEIAGRITATSPHFKAGGSFKAGERLITLDPTDYHYAVTIAEAEQAQANLTLEKSRAEAAQAEANWKRMKLSAKPTALTLHRPQLAQAEAALAAASAKLKQTKRELTRTQIVAPYSGRLLEKRVDLGQFVTRGAPLATLYATDLAEVRLPITDRQSRFLTLPESGIQSRVTLSTTHSDLQWQGRLVRSEAAIDSRTQQLYVVAQIENPYATRIDGTGALRIGQFVHAEIEGKTLQQVYRVPRVAVRNGDEVLTVDDDNQIRHRTLTTIWQQTDQLIVSAGVEPGDRIVTTALPYAPEGMQVKVSKAESSLAKP